MTRLPAKAVGFQRSSRVLRCPVCLKTFTAYRHGKQATQVHCNATCAGIARRSAPVQSANCVNCGVAFSAKRDHGTWTKYCGRACYLRPVPVLK